MPKLSADTLAKRFVCSYCGKSIRSRQGLSGHIQFKHSNGKKSSQVDELSNPFNIAVLMKAYEIGAYATGVAASEIKAKKDIIHRLTEVDLTCNLLDLKVNLQDLKAYVIIRLALFHNQQLK